MRAIVSGLGVGRNGSKHRRITLRFPEGILGDSSFSEVTFDEAKLGIVGLQLADELELCLLPRKWRGDKCDVWDEQNVDSTPEPLVD